MHLKKIIVYLGIFGALQFLLLTAYAMWVYPGGTIHERGLEYYSFFTNYFSDLGRTKNFRGELNTTCHNIFKITLTISGICIMLFFSLLPSVFKSEASKFLSWCGMFFGIVAGACYIGIGWVAWNVDYWLHIFYVTRGFIAFLIMSIFYALAIFVDDNYPNKYGIVMVVFIITLFLQILVMMNGPRSWSSPEALRLQAVSQKIVVYSEIFVLLYQSFGMLKMLQRQEA